MNIHLNTAHHLISFFNENFLPSLTSTLNKVLAIAAIAFGILAVCLIAYRYCSVIHKGKAEQIAIPNDDEKLQPGWINDHPDTSLVDLGLTSFDAILDYVQKNGKDLRCLNLKGLNNINDPQKGHINDAQFAELMKCCPNLKRLEISSHALTDAAFVHLEGMSLTSVNFNWCTSLTDEALAHLKGMPIVSVSFIGCVQITDNGLSHLQGMSLTSVVFGGCPKLTDAALAHLKEMKLTSVDFTKCMLLTDDALAHLKGMHLERVAFRLCREITDSGLAHLKGMPLKSVNFEGCYWISDEALKQLVS